MKKTFPVFLFIFLNFYPFTVYAAEQENTGEDEAIDVTADGVGTIKDDVANARRSAIDDGLRIAVEQAKGVFVNAETEAESYALVKDEIVTKCKGYVKTYKILNENKDDKVSLYRVRLQAAVLLSNPKEQAPVVFDEQKFTTRIPEIIREAMFISKRTNDMAEMINTKRIVGLNPEKLKKLRQHYLIMVQLLNSIEPPKGKREGHQMLKKAILLKSKALHLYTEYIYGKGRAENLKLANAFNKEANEILRDLKERFPRKGAGVKERLPHRPRPR
ncbi:MAG: hypothetical protein HZB54_03740 [Deltaproteobacteria bacterium]|nr:hypothetical protein [Deltaproteobacteria bacterium]